MFDTLTNVTWGLIVFAVMIGVGSLLLYNFSGSLAICATDFPYNATAGSCMNSSGSTATPTGTGYTTVTYLVTQLGSTSGGLASWAPAIIAVTIGILFIGYLGSVGGGNKKVGRY